MNNDAGVVGDIPGVIDIKEIMKLLPHRYPFILVDRILKVESGQKIVGLKNVTINEPFFQGHFPAEPVMPGVLILEGMAQTGGILAYLTEQELLKDKLIYFAAIDGVKFRRTVVPGDQLILELKYIRKKANMRKMHGSAFVNEKLVAEAELMAAFS